MWSSGVGLQPDGGAVRQQQVEGGRVRHQAAGRGDHRLGVDLDRLFERAALVAAVGVRRRTAPGSRRCCSRRTSRSRGSARRRGNRGRRPASGRAWTCRRRAGRSARRAGCAPALRAAACRAARRWPRARGAASASSRLLEQLADQQPLGRRGGHVADQFGQRALQRARPPAAAPGSRRCRRRTPGWPGAARTRRPPAPRALRVMPRRARRRAPARRARPGTGSCPRRRRAVGSAPRSLATISAGLTR